MLRLLNHVSAQVRRPVMLVRCYSLEAQTNLDNLDNEKKRKIFALEIDVSSLNWEI